MGQLNALKDFVLAMNKRNEIIPYEIIFEYLDSVNRQNVYLYYSSIRSISQNQFKTSTCSMNTSLDSTMYAV